MPTSINVIEFGIITDFKLEQFSKAYSLINITESGIV